jgi:hypothetical protein
MLKKKQNKKKKINSEARQNLVGFFNVLLEADKENNPEKYKKTKNVRYSNS